MKSGSSVVRTGSNKVDGDRVKGGGGSGGSLLLKPRLGVNSILKKTYIK